MQRLKNKELDPSKPHFSNVQLTSCSSSNKKSVKAANEILMTKSDVIRKIRAEELKSPEARENAWFVVRGEVYIYIYFDFYLGAR